MNKKLLSSLIYGLVLLMTGISNAAGGVSRVVDTNLIDKSVSPCENFFQYSCGEWLKKNEIPKDRPRLYRFSEIDISTEKLLKGILDNYKTGKFNPPQKYAKKIGDFYEACTQEKKSNKAGQLGIKSLFNRIDLLKTVSKDERSKAVAQLVAELHQSGISALFNFYVDQDPGDATQVIPQMDQGGMGLPEKGYYLDIDVEKDKIRSQYLSHLKKMIRVSSMDSNSKKSKLEAQIFEFEKSLSTAALSPIERRDPKALYHKMSRAELQKLAPLFDWTTYFTTLGITSEMPLNVQVPHFLTSMSELVSATSIDQLALYLKWYSLHSVADFSSTAVIQEDFNFYSKIMNGQKVPRLRWKECVASVDSYLGEALGESFVEVAFSSQAKNLAASMMNQIQDEVRLMFRGLDWMDEETMNGAIKKLNTLVKKVGYPDQPRNYDSLKINRNSWFENVTEGRRHEFQRILAKVGKPVDRGEWGMTSPTNNAYYNPLMNEIVFPAGILQEPLFGINADLAANYGATGATIGHEITHGFDDEGRQFDKDGNLKDWWTENSTKKFNEKAQCISKQYDQYTVANGVHVKGDLTLGENIADLGGLKIALKAYEKAANTTPTNQEYQRFFIAYAQSWCGKATAEYEKNIVQVDPHSPVIFRVNGVVVNMPEFSNAFSCKEGQTMNPKNRCQVW